MDKIKNEKKIKIITGSMLKAVNNKILINYRKKIYLIFIIIFIIIFYEIMLNSLGKNSLRNKKTKKLFFLNKFLNFNSHPQHYEDLILFCVFYDAANGFYIDIGANDPNIFSVTKSFYLIGWNGINIEPLQDKYELLLKERKRDINLKIGAGKEKGNFTFFPKGVASTFSKIYTNENSTALYVEVDTMSNICKNYIPKNKIIQFCKIDVEGGERDVLLGYDFENYRPKVFCIESTKPGTDIPCHALWEDILLRNNYSFVYQYRINRFYIDNKIRGLREKFIKVDKILRLYALN